MPLLTTALGSIANSLLKEGVRWGTKKLASGNRVRSAVDSTCERFGTRISSLEAALTKWVASAAFQTQIDAITSGLAFKTEAEHVDTFIRESGLQLGTVEFQIAREALTHFYSELYVHLCQADEGLGVIGSRIAAVDQKLDLLLAQQPRQTAPHPDTSAPGFSLRVELDTTARATTAEDQQAETELNLIKQLIDGRRPSSALELLSSLQPKIDQGIVSSAVRFRFFVNKGVCHLIRGETDQAAREFERARLLEPENKKALINLAQVAHMQGDNKSALELSDRVLLHDSTDITAHSLRFVALHKLGRQEEIDAVLGTDSWLLEEPDCLYSLAYIAFDSGRYEEAEYLVRQHDDNDDQHAEVWELLGRAILVPAQETIREQAPSPTLVGPAIQERLREAEMCFDRAVQLLTGSDATADLTRALVNRGVTRGLLSRPDEARRDYERVLEIDPQLDEARQNLGMTYLDIGKPDAAVSAFLEISDPAVRNAVAPMLAGAYLDLDKAGEARRVLTEVLHEDAETSDSLRLKELLLVACHRLQDLTVCEEIVAELNPIAEGNSEASTILAQHYYRVGEKPKAVAAMRTALELAPNSQKSYYRLLLAEMLYRVQEFEAATKEYEEIPLPVEESAECRRYLISLYNSGRLAKALEVARAVRGPRKAIRDFSEIEALILERSGGLASASDLRQGLLRSGVSPARQRLKIASNYNRLGRIEEARPLVEAVTLEDAGSDDELLFEAARLRTLLEIPDALEFAYRLVLAHPNNPDSHLFYVSTFFRRETIDKPLLEPDRVAVGTTVTLRHRGETQRFTLVEGEGDPSGNRLGPSHGLSQALQGKVVGDKLLFPQNTPAESEYSVMRIQSKYVFTFQDCLSRFNERFPSHQGLTRVEFKADDPTAIVQMLEQQRAQAAQALAIYHARSLPACTLARLLGRSDVELFADLIADSGTRVMSSAGTQEEAQHELDLVSKTSVVLVESSALVTFESLGLLSKLPEGFQHLLITQQTLDAIVETSRELDPEREVGHMYSDSPGHIHMVEYSREQMEERKQFFWRIVEFCQASTEVVAPTTTEALGEFEKENLQKTLGDAACSTVAAAVGSAVLVYSDDLVLRIVARNTYGIGSFWTQNVLKHLRACNVISPDEYHHAVDRLIDFGYNFVSIEKEDLLWILQRHGWRPTADVIRFAGVLSGPECNEPDAIRLSLDVLHELWQQPLHEQSKRLLLDMFIQILLVGRKSHTVLHELLRQNANRSRIWTRATGEIQKAIQLWFSAKRQGF